MTGNACRRPNRLNGGITSLPQPAPTANPSGRRSPFRASVQCDQRLQLALAMAHIVPAGTGPWLKCRR
jgi:hypothetical protein